MNKNNDFGKTLRELRESKGLSKWKLAKMARISASEEAELEEGKRYPMAKTVAKLADALGVSVSLLILSLKTDEIHEQK